MAQYSINLFGAFHMQGDGVTVTRFHGDKVRALLSYLAVEADRPHARGALTGLSWPDQPEAQARRNLTQSLVRLRHAFGADADPLHTTHQSVQWRTGVAEVDVTTFARLAQSTEFTDLVRAVTLYGGDFLSGFESIGSDAFDEWLMLTRERLRQDALTVLHTVAARHLTDGRFAHAADSSPSIPGQRRRTAN